MSKNNQSKAITKRADDYSQWYLDVIDADGTNPTIETLQKITKALDVGIDYITK